MRCKQNGIEIPPVGDAATGDSATDTGRDGDIAKGWALPLLLGAVLGGVSAFILSRPSRPAPLAASPHQ